MAGLIRQNLSSNSIFHFTSKREYLIDILKNGFQARYCYEKFPKLNLPFAIPMKCFCDIPLGQIKFHISRYKGYGIGITKSFARGNGITPVIYVHKNSKTLLGYLREIVKSVDNSELSLLPYFKKYSGVENNKTIRYYDEKEWRYVPDDYDLKDLKSIHEDSRKEHVKNINKNLSPNSYRLLFSIEDITYLFVEKNQDVPDLIQDIKNTKNTYNSKEIDLLISKIITSNQIISDF